MVIVAIDSFKGSLTSREACFAAREALIGRGMSPDEILACPISDGGEGFCDVVSEYVRGRWVSCDVISPLGESVPASYLFGDDGVAYIESASACGYCQVPSDRRNPLNTSSFGLGQLVADALRRGAVKIVVGLGGTSTCDAGIGMLQALGARFILSDGSVLPDGEPALMKEIVAIDFSSVTHPDGRESGSGIAPGSCRFDGAGLDFGSDIGPVLEGTCRIEAWADVPAPMCGEGGTVLLYAPQKGLPDQLLPDADAWMWRMARLYDGAARSCAGDGGRAFGDSPLAPGSGLMTAGVGFPGLAVDGPVADVPGASGCRSVADLPGAGAAGGIGGALHTILGAKIKSGADEIIALSGLADHLAEAELVLTGEGRCDEQTLTGKLPARIAAAVISAWGSSQHNISAVSARPGARLSGSVPHNISAASARPGAQLSGSVPHTISAVSARPGTRLSGSVPHNISAASARPGARLSGSVPRIICLCGQNSLPDNLGPFDKVIQITPAGMPLDQALDKVNASANIRHALTNCL